MISMEPAHGVAESDQGHRCWETCSDQRNSCCAASCQSRYLKPVLQSRGWNRFVNDRGITVGDVVCFWEEENPTYQTQYRIALFKPHLFPGHPDLHGV
ncbi:hypothetical protein ACE6H2_027256 [Prunus campanulata]